MVLQNYQGICCFGADRTTRIYTGFPGAATIATAFYTWQKPKGVKNIFILALGGGRRVGKNTAGDNTANRIGGGGGGAGALTVASIPAALLPDILYVQPGNGGPGGTGNGNGTNGAASYVLFYPDSAYTASNRVVLANGGSLGTAAGAAGGGGAASTGATSPISFLGICASYAGGGGAAGSTGAAGGNSTAIATGAASHCMACGGAAGGGKSTTTAFAGGTVNTGGMWQTVWGSIAGGAAGLPGTNGINYGNNFINNYESISNFLPLVSSGGSGGGAATAGSAGAGADGGFGSGGGGGGSGTTAIGSGAGGSGGAGVIIITCEF